MVEVVVLVVEEVVVNKYCFLYIYAVKVRYWFNACNKMQICNHRIPISRLYPSINRSGAGTIIVVRSNETR